MPAEGVHLTALREAAASSGLSAEARRRILRREDAARLGALVVDLPYFDRYGEEVVRYALRRQPRPSPWGAALHEGGAVTLLAELVERARAHRDDDLAAVALGLASHAAIDRALHPLVNALARRHPEGADHGASHREVEKFQSICFHEEHHGRDLMGDPAMLRHLGIATLRGLARSPLGQRLAAAIEVALAAAGPTDPAGATRERCGPRELARLARGYRLHTWLLASPVGARIAPPPEKERARPLFLRGAWGDFATVLERAVERSLPVLDATAACLDATDAEAARAREGLLAALPPGTIDGQGEDVSLDRPFVV